MAVDTSNNVIDDIVTPSGQASRWLKRHWFSIVIALISIYVILPWLAPIFVSWGWTKPASAIYLLYATQCHQLPQRSFFLFGNQPMHSLAEIQAVWENSSNPLALRRFIGNPDMGWKVAWSDRMVYMYSSIILWGIILFYPLRRILKPLPWWGLFLLLLPMAIDGGSHYISDIIGGIGGGFRDSNLWLAALTGNAFTATFYAGDALGSFNSVLRLITGILFGLGIVWFFFPRLQRGFVHE